MIIGFGGDVKTVGQLRVTFIPERVERYLSKIKVDSVPVKLDIAGTIKKSRVRVIAVGDALGTTDFFVGQATNRGFSMANQIFKSGRNPKVVYAEMVENTFNTHKLFETKAVDAREWVLAASGKQKEIKSFTDSFREALNRILNSFGKIK